jgi:hypothetical protein
VATLDRKIDANQRIKKQRFDVLRRIKAKEVRTFRIVVDIKDSKICTRHYLF